MNLMYICNELECVGWDELQNKTTEVQVAKWLLCFRTDSEKKRFCDPSGFKDKPLMLDINVFRVQ